MALAQPWLGSFEGLQTAVLNALKTKCCGLSGVGKIKATVCAVSGSFEGWQTAVLNALKTRCCCNPSDFGKGLAREQLWPIACGSCREAFRRVLVHFEGWQTAVLNALKPRCCGRSCVGKQGAVARVALANRGCGPRSVCKGVAREKLWPK